MQGAVVACLEQDIWFDLIPVEKSCVRVVLAQFFVRPTIWGSCNTQEWVKSHTWMSQVTRKSQSCHTYEQVMLHIWMSHVTHMNESCITHMNEWCHTYNKSCHTYKWVTSHIQMSPVTHIWQEWCTRDSYVWRDSCICVAWLRHMCGMTDSYVWYMIRSYVRHDWFIWMIWLIHMCDLTHSCVLHDPQMVGRTKKCANATRTQLFSTDISSNQISCSKHATTAPCV